MSCIYGIIKEAKVKNQKQNEMNEPNWVLSWWLNHAVRYHLNDINTQ